MYEKSQIVYLVEKNGGRVEYMPLHFIRKTDAHTVVCAGLLNNHEKEYSINSIWATKEMAKLQMISLILTM